jgi:hypothetical protein
VFQAGPIHNAQVNFTAALSGELQQPSETTHMFIATITLKNSSTGVGGTCSMRGRDVTAGSLR